MSNIRKLIYLSDGGIQTRTEDGAIANLGGIYNTAGTFTVNGKGLLFDDGTSTNGSPGQAGGGGSTLQAAYDASTDIYGNATIVLSTTKDFAIYDDITQSVYFKIASGTGAVTITGDLNVLGAANFTNLTEISDHWSIQPSNANVVAFSIEPIISNGTPIADLINVKKTNGGTSVFRVDATGKMISSTAQINGNMTVVGLINGIDIVALDNEVGNHVITSATPKHTAAEIRITPPIQTLPGITNVQDALAGLATQVANISLGSAVARGFEFIQTVQSASWTVVHNQNTNHVQFTAYDAMGNWILPNSFAIIDNNSVRITFGSPQAGKVVLMMF